MSKPELVDALYITSKGFPFFGKAETPIGSFASLKWKYPDEEIVVEYVFFGHYKNRVVFHEIDYDEQNNHV